MYPTRVTAPKPTPMPTGKSTTQACQRKDLRSMGQEYQPAASIIASHNPPATTITTAVTAVATRSHRVGIAGD